MSTYISSTVTSLVEWKEVSLCTFKSGSHIHTRQIYCKMHKDTFFECKDGIFSCTVKFVLINSISCTLTCELAFQFQRYNRDTIYKKYNVDTILIVERVVELTCALKNVCFILSHCLWIYSCFWFPEHRTEFHTSVCKTLSQHTK